MEDKTNQLIQVFNKNGRVKGIFRFTGNNCPEDHLQTVLEIYFEYLEGDEERGELHLLCWGLERVYIEHEIII